MFVFSIIGCIFITVVGGYLGNGTIGPIPRSLQLGLSRGVSTQVSINRDVFVISGNSSNGVFIQVLPVSNNNSSLEHFTPLCTTPTGSDQSSLLSSLLAR